MTLIEAIQSFHSEVTAKPLSANARSLWLAIICLWNDRRRPSTITVGTPELRRLAGIKAKTTYHDALNALMSRKLVKICKRRGDLIELEPMPLRNSDELKSKALLSIPKKTKTECAREAEGLVDKIANQTHGKYAGMTLAQMREARLKEKSLNRGGEQNGVEYSGGNRSREEITIGIDAKGRGSDTRDSDAFDGGGFLSTGAQADIQGAFEA